MKKFVSYEKETISVIQNIKHIVRLKIHSSATDIIEILKLVPKNAILVETYDDLVDPWVELVFKEEGVSY